MMVMILSERASTEQHRLLLVLSCVPIEWMIRNDRPFCHHLWREHDKLLLMSMMAIPPFSHHCRHRLHLLLPSLI